MEHRKAEVVIIGSGIAGLFAAKKLSEYKQVILITKGKITNSNSILAQGGIAASIDKLDHWNEHFQDTITAGVFHNDEDSTMDLVKSAKEAINQLIELGVPFDRDNENQLALGQEGGHHKRRIVHAGGDSTGREVILKLIEETTKSVKIYEDELVIDLLIHDNQCHGVITKDNTGKNIIYQAPHVILATGGIGNLYTVTSNDNTITGDGLAIAYRAGAELADLEFIQFHPTMLKDNKITYGLISEAVRGEGAKLIDEDGNLIMDGIHPLFDLAPRDVVARRIFEVLQSGKKVFLDISMIKNFISRFPTISKMCHQNKIDLEKGFLPVSPGAHFIMGGIKTNLVGKTSIDGLYAVGEVAYTGVHGANRLASNSLLEGIVFANKLVDYIKKIPFIEMNAQVQEIHHKNFYLPKVNEIQQIMTHNVGIIRNEKTLMKAKLWFEYYLKDYNPFETYDLSKEDHITINMLLVGWLITTSALKRTESRGGHYRNDYPVVNDKLWLKKKIVRRREDYEPYQAKAFVATIIS